LRDPIDAEPFAVAVPEAVLEDLRARLARTRWPGQPDAAPWAYGADLGWMRAVAAHWAKRFDWRAWEARLNAAANFRATIDGRRVHFLLERGSGERPLPLLLTHGWPGSVVEFLDVVAPLAHPERFGGDVRDAFTVIVPSLPGFGFSDPPAAPIGPRAIAATWARLMRDVLGCDAYVAQGGDWGAMVTSWLAVDHPRGLRAIHLNGSGLAGGADRGRDGEEPLSPEEEAWAAADLARRAGKMHYQHIQATQSQTLAYGLTDSPVGLAAWILEKFRAWSPRGADGLPPFALDHLLANVMLYWLAGINSANWMYVSLVDGSARAAPPGLKVQVPAGFTLCPDDNTIPPPDRWLARRFANVVHRQDAARGGHFLALEQGDLFVATLRRFFRAFR
jgi:microsomal epoxide hydrolase